MLLHLRTGDIDRTSLRPYATRLVAMAEQFPMSICALLGVCRARAVREVLLTNLLEEEGMVLNDRGALVTDPEKTHGSLARRFARRTGATDAEMDALPVIVNPWFDAQLRRGNWIGPFAFFSVGFEANVPETFRLFLRPLRDRWRFTDDDLVYFAEHVTADERHGVESAAMIASLAATDETRSQALEGARRGGLAFWHVHRRGLRRDA